MTKILITGGAGCIGSQRGYYLNKLGNEVFLLDNMNHGHRDNLEIDGESFGWFIDDDIRRPTMLSHVSGMDYVNHLVVPEKIVDMVYYLIFLNNNANVY